MLIIVTNIHFPTKSLHQPETAVIPFVPSKLFLAAKWTLDLLDYYGEKLAFFFGITSPKYAVQIRAHDRDVRQEEERKKTESQEFAGWREGQRHGYENPVMNHVQDQVN